MKAVLIISTIFFFAIGLSSCTKESDSKNVDYLITGLSSPYTITYINENGKSISATVHPKSVRSQWKKHYQMKQGSPVYLYAKFKENIAFTNRFNIGILINGKYHYQSLYYDKNLGDTLYEVKIAGVVPYD